LATEALAVSVVPRPLLTRFPVEIRTIDVLASSEAFLIEFIAKLALAFMLIAILFFLVLFNF
jgi:hypothetical protein